MRHASLRFAPYRKTLFINTLALSLWAWTATAHADGLAALDVYLKNTTSGSAAFTQTVTQIQKKSPPKTSTGTFAFIRPHQFRFDYQKPYRQHIVADGKTLWIYDADLQQVTTQKQSQALNATPAALIATATGIEMLKASFHLDNEARKDVLEWVRATPKVQDGPLQNILMGFKGQELRRIEILDSFGQHSVIEFHGVDTARPAPSRFQFKPPADATVLEP